MFVHRRLLSVLVLAVVALATALGILVISPAPSWAADYSGNQSIDQPASLMALEPNAKIAVYLRPEAKSRVGYGVNGDAITVLEKVSDNQGVAWNHIRFDNPSHAEGWVQEEFISSKADMPGQTPGQSQQMTAQMAQQNVQNGGTADHGKSASQGSRYLGDQQSSAGGSTQSKFNQQPQFSHQNGQQSYSQRNQN